MASKLRFPIRYKILAVLSLVVIAAVAFYLYLAANLFYEDKTVLVYELTQNNVRTLGAEISNDFKRVADKLRLVTSLMSKPDIFAQLFKQEDELVAIRVFRQKESAQPIFSYVWSSYLATFQRDGSYLEKIRAKISIPFDRVQSDRVWIRASFLDESNAPPLYTIAMLASDDANASPLFVVAEVRGDRLLDAFAPSGVAKSYAIDSERQLLAHTDQSLLVRSGSLTNDPLVLRALGSKAVSEVLRFEEDGQPFLGAFSKAGVGGVLVASKVETGAAFAAAWRLVKKSVLYAIVIITVAFIVAWIFSHSLTEPIQQLVEATQEIARGQFDTKIDLVSRDELASLASSFNSMTHDLKSSREKIEEYSRDLEKKVQDRTRQLEEQNVAIKEAQEALVRTTRLASVGEVAGRAAHEVLNPLTNITARLEKMQGTSLKADLDDLKLYRDILEAWQNASLAGKQAFISQLLDVQSQVDVTKTLLQEDIDNLNAIGRDFTHRLKSRQDDLQFLLKESGRINKIVNGMRQLTRVSGVRREVDVHALLNEALATMRDVLAKRKIQTRTDFGSEKLTIRADRDELMQVLSNLIRNSMQAIEEVQRGLSKSSTPVVGEPPMVWLSTRVVESEGRKKVQMRVHDNGPGIPEELFQKVFEPSFTTKTVEEGTGLGLSIARRFIRALEGEIIVEKSKAGVETVFLIELPT